MAEQFSLIIIMLLAETGEGKKKMFIGRSATETAYCVNKHYISISCECVNKEHSYYRVTLRSRRQFNS